MGFLLGLFVGATIFILGFIFGGSYRLNRMEKSNNDYIGESENEIVVVKLQDFGALVDQVLDCQERNVPLVVVTETEKNTMLQLIFKDGTMHVS
jgi:hypothetical protein